MTQSEIIQAILELGVQAPSGENAQPWKFKVAGDEVSLFNIPENDQSLYNFGQRASYIAHGAVIENIQVAASHFGLNLSVNLFPDEHDPNLVAKMILKQSDTKEDPLYQFIAKRSTNRKPYKDDGIAPEIIEQLSQSSQGAAGVNVKFVSDPSKIGEIANIASLNDRLLLENKELHDFFFSHLHWTLEEETEKRSGFYIEVLELLPPAKVLFRFFKYWSLMKIFNALGMPKVGAKENSKIYASAPAIGIISISGEANGDFVEVGRSLQKMWLTITSKGLSMQPLTGILFFHQRIKAGKGDEFSPEQKQAIENAYAGIASIFSITNGVIAMMFRIGYAEPPTASSLKMPPTIITE